MQFCLAHLLRDVKFLTTLPEVPMTIGIAYGRQLLEGLRTLFHILHQRELMEVPVFQKAVEKARNDLVATGLDASEHKPAQNMAGRFRQNRESYFRFITAPGLEPTNNLAEQAIRFVGLDRHATHGTRSEWGQKWCESRRAGRPPSPPARNNNAACLNSFTKLSAITSRENPHPHFFHQARERVQPLRRP